MVLIMVVVAGIGVALLRGGSLRGLVELPLRVGWLAVVCLLAQVYVTLAPADQLESQRGLHAALLMGSYAALAVVVWANRRITGVLIIGLGLLLNLVVMAANGGFMPITREAILAAGIRSAQELPAEGARISRTKDVLLSAEQTRLAFLSDVIVAPPVPTVRVYSLGDLVIAAGAFTLFQAAMVPSRRGAIKEKSEANATP